MMWFHFSFFYNLPIVAYGLFVLFCHMHVLLFSFFFERGLRLPYIYYFIRDTFI